jgi:hypothetical protein
MIDRYTKFLLTVIALSLVVIVVRDIPFVQNAFAVGETGRPVAVIVKNEYPIDITIKRVDWTLNPLPVKVAK